MQHQEDQLAQIELTIEEAKKQVNLRDAIIALHNSPNFQLVVENGYFEKEALRLVMLVGDARLRPEDQGAIYEDIRAIASLRRYLDTAIKNGNMAERAIKEAEEEAALVRAEAEGVDPEGSDAE